MAGKWHSLTLQKINIIHCPPKTVCQGMSLIHGSILTGNQGLIRGKSWGTECYLQQKTPFLNFTRHQGNRTVSVKTWEHRPQTVSNVFRKKTIGGWETSTEDSQSTIFSRTQALNSSSSPVSLPSPPPQQEWVTPTQSSKISVWERNLSLTLEQKIWVTQSVFATDFNVLGCPSRAVNSSFRPHRQAPCPCTRGTDRTGRWKNCH